MSNNLQRIFLKPAEEKSGSASHCVSGCMYQVVQTIGSDGKNLLQLLPIPNSSGNPIPLVQSSVMSDALKGNTGSPVQVTFKTQISSSSTAASVQLPIFQPANSSNYFLTRTVETTEKVRVTSVVTENLSSSVSKVQSHGVKIDGLTMQTFAVSPSSTQNDSSYFIVNTQSLPMTVKSPVLPSGHHLQIPAHAEVKSVPASSLPPSVQQKILASATTSTSGTVEASQIPTVIYVSPVNTVKSVVTKNFQSIYPKPVTEIAKPIILNTTQIPKNVPKETQLKGGQHSQTAPVKWIFQENLQPSLVPVKSSNNVASKILKTFVDRKSLGDSTISMPPLSTIGSSRTQSKSMPIKDNALVMFNGKVYLLAKKGTDVLPAQTDQQNSVSPDIPPRKDTSQIVSSSPVTEISREVVNFVLAKSKSSLMETKSLSNTQLASMANLRAEKNKKVEKPSLSTPDPHNSNQSINYLKQSKTLLTKPVLPDGFSTGQNAPRKGNIIQSIEKISSSIDATSVTSQQCVFRDQEPKIQNEMASTFKKVPQERNDKKSEGRISKASCLKSDAELKKIFGLTKDVRVCLKRIPDILGSEESSDTFRNLVKSDTHKEKEFTKVKEDERKQQGFDKKRKAKAFKRTTGNTKKRKSQSTLNTPVNGGTDVTNSQLISSVLPASDVPQDSILTSSNKTSRDEEKTELEQCTNENKETVTLNSNAAFEESHSFNISYTEDIFPMTPPQLEETVRDEKIRRLKQALMEKEAALEEIRKKMHQK